MSISQQKLLALSLFIAWGLIFIAVWQVTAESPREEGGPAISGPSNFEQPACSPGYSTLDRCGWIAPVTQNMAGENILPPPTYSFPPPVRSTPTLKGRIIFMSNRTGRWHIYVMQADGSSQTALTRDPNCDDSTPRVSPDLKRIVYRAQCGSTYGAIVGMNIDGSNPITLTNGATYDNSYPTWSPDGSKIAFASTRTMGVYNLYTMNANGSGATAILTTTNKYTSQPVWSPNGQMIAFVSNRDAVTTTTSDVYRASIDGSNWMRLTTTVADNWYPTWSPDSSTILFSSWRDGHGEIYTVSASGGEANRLTTTVRDNWAAVYSPDGQAIAFSSVRDGYQAIYAMNLDGSNPTALTWGVGEQHSRFPAWIANKYAVWLPLIRR